MTPKRPKLRPDMNEVAYRIVQAATGEGPHPQPPGVAEKNAEAVKRGLVERVDPSRHAV